MQLPKILQDEIEDEIERIGWQTVLQAREDLTNRYRQGIKEDNYIQDEAHRCAYIAARMPATYAAIYHVLSEIVNRVPEITIKSLLDCGAGPGTGMWAAANVFPSLERIVCIEKDHELTAIGKKFAAMSDKKVIQSANWEVKDFLQSSFANFDLILFSYSIGELDTHHISKLIEKCWSEASHLLVVIEPGTPVGFDRIHSIRRQLINLNAHLVAPCPHALTCPLAAIGDWCHFSERVERSSEHRRLKGGSLGFEDEKFSYIVASKIPYPLPDARIVRHPEKHSGHINLTLCTSEGLKKETISRRYKEKYKQAKKSNWGDAWNNIV